MTETRPKYPTGAIVDCTVSSDGTEELTAAVTMTVAEWDVVTDWINDLYRCSKRDERPSLPLSERIVDLFDPQTEMWAHEARQASGDSVPVDLDDDVPF